MILGVWVWRAGLELLDYLISDHKKNSKQRVLQSCWEKLAISNSYTENKANKKVRLYHLQEYLENVIIVYLHSHNKNFLKHCDLIKLRQRGKVSVTCVLNSHLAEYSLYSGYTSEPRNNHVSLPNRVTNEISQKVKRDATQGHGFWWSVKLSFKLS